MLGMLLRSPSLPVSAEPPSVQVTTGPDRVSDVQGK